MSVPMKRETIEGPILVRLEKEFLIVNSFNVTEIDYVFIEP